MFSCNECYIYAAFDDDGGYFRNVRVESWNRVTPNSTVRICMWGFVCTVRGPSIDKGTMIFYVWYNLLCVVGIGFGGLLFLPLNYDLKRF